MIVFLNNALYYAAGYFMYIVIRVNINAKTD